MSHRYYVVFAGRAPGVYASWDECRAQVDGFAGAMFRGYPSPEAAARAWQGEVGHDDLSDDDAPGGAPEMPAGAIAVDAACSGNPGPMEYRGVALDTRIELFRHGPIHGTNNLGEFLAIVHGLAWLSRRGAAGPVFSDSRVAIGWVHQARVKTTLARSPSTECAWTLVDRALVWLRSTPQHAKVLKWPTHAWGEIPADFGRK